LRDEGHGRRAFRWLAGILLVLLGVVILSALQRMRLYLDQYGLTELRLYATGTILWLAAVCAWFAVTVLRGKRQAFAVGALVAGFAATVMLNVVNPDALIARTNVTRPAVDVRYLGGLSDDAVPTLVAGLSNLPREERPFLATRLLDRYGAGDWRAWNLSRARADRAVRAHRAELERWVALDDGSGTYSP
jgi:predicted acyltransferase